MTFEDGDYHKYIKWLSDKINSDYSLKQCLIHHFVSDHTTIFSDFTAKLLKNKNMIGEFKKYNQKSAMEGFYHKIVINNSLRFNELYNILLVYQLDKIPIREIYKNFEIKDNIIDYECYMHNYKIDLTRLNDYIEALGYNPFTVITHKFIVFDKELEEKIYNTLNNEEIMNQVYEFIKTLN